MRPLRLVLLAAALSVSALAAPPAAGADQSMAGWSADALQSAKLRIAALRADLVNAPREATQALASTRTALMSGAGVRGFTYFMILLFTGIAVEWLYWTYAYSPLRAVQAAQASTPLQALRLGLRRLLLLGSGLLLFTIAAIGASAALAWPPGIHELVIAATLLALALRLSWIGVSIVLAPGRPALQLVPADPARARWLAAAAMSVLCLLALGQFLPDILERATGARHAAAALRFVAFSAAAMILLCAAFAFFGRKTGDAASRALVFPRSFVLALLVAAVYVVWVMNPDAAPLAAIIAIVIALQLGLRAMVYFYWRDESDPASAQGALPAIVLSLARFVVVLLGLGACAMALDTPISELAASEKPLVLLGLRLLAVAAMMLLANVVWIATRSTIDHRLQQIRPRSPHDRPGPGARLLTLLPLLRAAAAVVIIVLLAISSLWALGIEITPFLAGAGVIGIALGFGAQALVRDVIAGIFFLAEDAFRVGEYIESGSANKGKVERISLRTVALRHHNGPLLFVPYGALGAVRNNSRDWVVDKFNIPLRIDVDSEKIRKMLKNIGEEMKADPVIGPMLLEPLKGKLYRIDPGVKIFRCKFQTAPGMQFDVRANAFKRIEKALKDMGVEFSDGRMVLINQEPDAA